MDINVYWSPNGGTNPVDEFNVLYKEYDPLGLNEWIIANPSPLPNTATSYTITGLDQNTVYRVMITKSCLGVSDVVGESTIVNVGCPIVATWQGPVVNSFPTLFYSVYYPEGKHIEDSRISLYDTETNDIFFSQCAPGTSSDIVIGRTTYLTGDVCSDYSLVYCDTQQLNFNLPSYTSSATGYFGYDTQMIYSGNTLLPFCDNSTNASSALLLKYNNDYKFQIFTDTRYDAEFKYVDSTCYFYAVDVTPFRFISDPLQTYPNLNLSNIANISPAFCFNPIDLSVTITNEDGTGRTNITDYTFTYDLYDTSIVGPYPYIKDNGLPETSNTINFRVFGEISYASSFANYLSAGMDINISFTTNVPGTISVLSLTNVDYTGFTLFNFLTDLANQINAINVYTAVVVPLGSGTYALRIYHSDVTILTINSSVFGPSTPIGVIGSPLLQNNFTGATSGITSAFEYNGFLYGARGNETTKSNIQVTEISSGITNEYQHTIDYPINMIELVPVAPPTEVFDIKTIQDAGTAPYNVAIDESANHLYIIDNTSISVYDSTSNTLIDSTTFASINPSMTYTYRYISVIEPTKEILLFGAPAGGPTNVDVITFLGVGNWSYLTTYTYTPSEPGGILYNPVTQFVYLSIGFGQVQICDAAGVVATVQLLEPDGITDATSAFSMAVRDTGTVYLIKRDSVADPSKHIYFIDTSNNPGVIDGTLTYNDYICGNISIINEVMYFTAKDTRIVIKYNLVAQEVTEQKAIPSLYEKMEGVYGEHAQGISYLSGDKFVVMNRMNNNNTPGTTDDYQVTNLFVYDYANNTIVQSLIGAPNDSYSGTAAGWNSSSLGQTFGLYSAGAYQNYCFSISIKISSQGFIYWKPTLNNGIYSSKMYSETGVAQLWATYSLSGAKNLIRIFNIQSDGSLLSSVRNIFQISGLNGSNFGSGVCNMKYDSYYNKVIFNGFLGGALNMFDPTTLSGYAGSDYMSSIYLTSESYVGDGSTTGIYYAQRVLSNNQGGIAVFGPHYPGSSNKFGYANFSTVDITTQLTNPTIDITGDAINPGLYNTDSYPQIYVSTTDTYWVMGRSEFSAGDVIINIYDAASSGILPLLDTINLTTSGFTVPSVGGVYMEYSPTVGHVTLYDGITKLLINDSTYNIIEEFTFLSSGSMVSASGVTYVDYLTGTPNEEAWGILGSTTVTSSANTYEYVAITITDSALATTSIAYDMYSNPSAYANTFGQWKEITGTTWATIPSTISTSLNMPIEFTSFILDKPLVEIRNITQGTTYTPSNTNNSITVYTITANSIELFNNDVLEFEFTNPSDPSCPFINQATITF